MPAFNSRAALAALACALVPLNAHAQPRTYANPMDVDYRYNFENLREGVSYRTGADPVIVNHKGEYYLFHTMADGYWHSTNLLDWRFVTPSRWPLDQMVAPAAWSDGERLYLKPSTFQPGPVLVSDDPASGKLEFYTRRMEPIPGALERRNEPATPREGVIPPGPWDPSFFKDDDGKWYFYWGSSNFYPLYGIGIDPATNFGYIGEPVPLMSLHPERHGWERFGQDHGGSIDPYVEGAWMTKHAGRYYLQYGAPGTEYNVYATGAYVSDAPLGPFEYAPWNPVAYKPGGYVNGAGHGSMVQDEHGNWWLAGTSWIGFNKNWERRDGLYSARFWPDGQLSADTRFADFPHYMPERPVGADEDLFTGWMLLSYRKAASASSTRGEFAAGRVTDEDPRTFWVADANEAGQMLTVDLGAVKTLRAVQVNFADYESGRHGDAPDIYTEFTLEASQDGRRWHRIARTEPPRRDRPNAYFELARPVEARYVRYVHGHVGAANLAIADLRVFGNAGEGAPPAPANVAARRHEDARSATVTWEVVPGAVGYNVRWGLHPDRLTQTYQRWADQGTQLELRALNLGVDYFVSVEAFDERGVSPLGEVRPM